MPINFKNEWFCTVEPQEAGYDLVAKTPNGTLRTIATYSNKETAEKHASYLRFVAWSWYQHAIRESQSGG